MSKLPVLTLRLFGGIEIRQNDAPVTGFVTHKALALFVYLVVTRQAHTRDHLATLLWGNLTDTSARGALRYTLWNLKQLLGPYLNITRHTIEFAPDTPHTCDVTAFTTLATNLADTAPTERDLAAWQEALVLYRGEFLQGMHVREAEEFDAWMRLMRERLHRTVAEVLERLVAYETAQQNLARGIEYARRLVELEAWNEDAQLALIRLYAAAGDTGAAFAQYEKCRHILAAEFDTEPGAAMQTLMSELRRAARTFDAPAPRPPNNLPARFTPFFGRQPEIARIVNKLREQNCRVLSLTGEGGIGKTRLAIEAGEQLQEAFADGVWFVPFAGIEANAQEISRVMARTTANALGLGTDPAHDLSKQLFEYLAPRRILLVLDNLEQLLATAHASVPKDADAADWITELLTRAPGAAVLATSRACLNLQAEYVMRLDGLPLPGDATKARAKEYASIQLFLERAERAGVRTSELDMAEVVSLCAFVQGMPLAIELAAAWMNRAAPSEMLHALQSNLDRLETAQRDIPARHRSARAVLESSWVLLSPAEQTVVASCAVFAYRFTRAAAEKIIGLPGKSNLVHLLDGIADKSLLRWDVTRQRYRLHPLVRQFAQEKISPDAFAATQQRHADYFMEFVTARTARLYGPDTRRALDQIEDALADILAAWDWCVAHQRYDRLTAAQEALAAFYEYTGSAADGLALLTRTLNAVDGDAPAQRMLRMQLTLSQSKLLLRMHEYVQVQAKAESVLEYAERTGDAELIAWSRYLRARGMAHLRDSAAEQIELERARQEAQAAQLPRLEALCNLRLCSVALHIGDYPRTKELATKAVQGFETVHDSRFIATGLSMLGLLQELLGEMAQATATHARTIELANEIRDMYVKATALHNLGSVLASQGQYERALGCMEQSEQCYIEAASAMAVSSQALKGVLYVLLGNWVQARRTLEPLAALQNAGMTHEYGWANRGLALLARRQGKVAQAVRFGRIAFETAQHWQSMTDLGEAGIVLADALCESGALQEAQELYHTVLAQREQMQQTYLCSEAIVGLAHVALRIGDAHAARAWLDKLWRGKALRLPPGPVELFWVYWIGYVVMRALDDARASRLLETAQFELDEYASQISDPYTRDQYLQVPWHRALLNNGHVGTRLAFMVVGENTA